MRPVQPMMAVPAAVLPAGPDWTYEVKWDGYRAQLLKNGATISLLSRNLKTITTQFPAIAHAAARLTPKAALFDGEIVALDPEGRPSFQALHHSATTGFSLVYYAFDLLHLNGRDLVSAPLDGRRAALRDAIAGSGVLLSEPLPGTPKQIEAAVRRLHLEGIVAKRRSSRYEPGRRSAAWVKVRFAKHQEFVIGGYKPNTSTFDSLLVGYYEGRRTHASAPAVVERRGLAHRGAGSGRRQVTRHAVTDPRVGPGLPLLCAGKVRNGFTAHLRAAIFDRLRAMATDRCPFANLPIPKSGHWGEGITAEEMHELRWVEPQLVAEISFVEWTRDGSLRHAAFLALRDDKDAKEVEREYGPY